MFKFLIELCRTHSWSCYQALGDYRQYIFSNLLIKVLYQALPPRILRVVRYTSTSSVGHSLSMSMCLSRPWNFWKASACVDIIINSASLFFLLPWLIIKLANIPGFSKAQLNCPSWLACFYLRSTLMDGLPYISVAGSRTSMSSSYKLYFRHTYMVLVPTAFIPTFSFHAPIGGRCSTLSHFLPQSFSCGVRASRLSFDLYSCDWLLWHHPSTLFATPRKYLAHSSLVSTRASIQLMK